MSRQGNLKTGDILQADLLLLGVSTVADKNTAVAIGARLAQLRKEKGITQGEMAELLDVSQPMVSDYERGELRLHGELILQITRILKVSADEVLGLKIDKRKTNGAAKNRRLARRLQAIDRLPKRDQEALLRTIDAFLGKAG